MNLHLGTSGFAYKEWKGSFYPADLPAEAMLRYYAERFSAVEINNTFYRMPSAALLEKWAQEVPDRFHFVLKAPRRITHVKRLKEVGDDVRYLVQVASTLGERLGPLFFQLPPTMKKDLGLLAMAYGYLASGFVGLLMHKLRRRGPEPPDPVPAERLDESSSKA